MVTISGRVTDFNAYLLFVDRPQKSQLIKHFCIVKGDTGNGDKGEVTFTLEEQNDYISPEGEIDATYKK